MFDKEFQFAIDQAQANIREDGELLPTFIGFGNEPELDKSCAVIVATPFVGTTFDEVEKSKQSAIDAVRMIWVAYAVERYIFLSETWMKEVEGVEAAKEWKKQKRLIANEPDRVEALMCIDVQYSSVTPAMFKMKRENGLAFELIDKPGIRFSGRMCELLPPKERLDKYITRDIRKMAAKILDRHGYAIGIELIEWGQK